MNRFDNTKKFMFSTIIKNNRLESYAKYIEYALASGYKVYSMDEFYNNKDSTDKKFVLRHDVDWNSVATRKMFELEKKMGVHSTYYFRKSTIDKKIIQEMLNAGFDVGLHYETISDYALENKINNPEEIDLDIVREKLKKEIKEFKVNYNKNMTSICSHGSPKNSELRLSNNVLLDGESYLDYDILFEAYDKNLYDYYKPYHIMDSNIRRGCGFSYTSNPIEGINANENVIIFLSHPNHWFFSFKSYIWNIICFILRRYNLITKRKFVRIQK